MIKLNELLKDLTAEMWKIKNNTNQIEMQELLDFYITKIAPIGECII